MAKDVIARLKVEHSQWDSGFSKAGKTLKDFEQKNLSMVGAMDQGVKALASSAAKYVGWGAAVAGAMKVAKDAFMANEQQLDEWGRVLESTQSLYEGFLTALNTGDISGYLSRIDQIVSAARNAYDAMDELGTFKAFNQRNELQGRNNLQNAINNFREGKGSKEDIQKAGDAYIKELQKRQTLESSNYAAQIRKVATDKGVDAQKLTQLLTGDYASYQKAKDVQMTGKKAKFGAGGFGSGQVEYDMYAANPQEKMGEALRMFNDTALQEIQRIGTEEIQTSLEIESVRKQVSRAMNGKVGGVVTTTTKASADLTPKVEITESVTELQALQNELKLVEASMTPFAKTSDDWKTMNEYAGELRDRIKELNGDITEITPLSADWFKSMQTDTSGMAMGTQVYFDAEQMNADWRMLQDSLDGTPLTLGVDISEEEWASFLERINAKLEELGIEPIDIPINVDTDKIKDLKTSVQGLDKNVQGAASAFSALGTALNQIDDPSAKVAGYIASAIGQTAQAFGTAQVQAATIGPWAWIAFAATGLATMISTIAGIKSATSGSYADGGLITGGPGTDGTMIRAHAGELVLNQAMQENVAAGLESNNTGGGNSTISGEDIVTVVNAYGRRSGRGEILK